MPLLAVGFAPRIARRISARRPRRISGDSRHQRQPLQRRDTASPARALCLIPFIALAGLLLLSPQSAFAATGRTGGLLDNGAESSTATAPTRGRTTATAPTSDPTKLTKWCTAPSGQRITVCSSSVTAPSGVAGHFNFKVLNPTTNDAGYEVTVACSGIGGTSCQPDENVIVVLSQPDGDTTQVPVSWTVPADSSGILDLTVVLSPVGPGATDTLTASLHVTSYVVPTYTVSVTPDGKDAYVTQPETTSYPFSVANLGNTKATYKLTATCSPEATNCSAPDTVTVFKRSSRDVTVSFYSGSAGSKGTVTLKATADSTGGPGTVGGIVTSDEGFINIKPYTHSVAVTPGGQAITKAAGSSGTATFMVTLTGTAPSVSFSLQGTCSAPVQCSPTLAPVTVTKTAPATVTFSYTINTDLRGGVGAITLRAYSVYGPKTYESTGSYQVTVPNTTDNIVITLASPTTAIERGACLTVSAGEAAAYECGNLRVVHGVPAVRTMGKARAPTLLYASETAEPRPSVRADLLLQSFATTPDSLTGVLEVGNAGSQQTCNQHWTTSGWTPGTVRRVVATCTSTALTTGAYPFTLEIKSIKSGVTTSYSKSGTLIVVNRSASPFGAGWSMAGLEQLYFPADADTRLWVAGDGSARLYRRVGTSNNFFADSLDGPDSLTYDPGTLLYTRWAAHRLRVVFNSAGLDSMTINRLGQTTTFVHDSTGLLQAITVPPSTAGLVFTFSYTSGKLSSVSSPGTPSGTSTPRVTTISQSSGRVNSITDPDTSVVSFGYSGTSKLITSRTDRLGHATSYAYNSTSGTLSSASIAMQSPTPGINTYFYPAEAVGLSGGAATDTSSVYTVLIDPRFNFSTIWVDKFGAPRRVLNSVNGVTVIERSDTRWPLLATKLTAAGDASTGHLTTTAVYDGHGNISKQTVMAPLGDTVGDAVTTYAYDEKFDFATRIQGPTGEVWRASIDDSTGNRLMESPTDTSDLHATSYHYDATCGMVSAVVAPSTPADSVSYDLRCNPSGTKSPLGFWSRMKTDAIGRVVADSAPDDMRDSTVYDIIGRVTKKITTSPTRNGVGSQTLTVESHYDKSGRLTSVTRKPSNSGSGITSLTNSYRYDWAGRQVAAVAPDLAVDSTVYDPAGNATKLITRVGGASLPITMQYDALNRLRKRSVPAHNYNAEWIGMSNPSGTLHWMHSYPMYPTDSGQTGYTVAAQVDTFAYDSAGRMTLANNGDSKVSRTYYPNGLIETETQKLRTLADTTSGGTFSDHVYTVAYEYDLAGRNTKLIVPGQLAPRVQVDTLAAVLMIAGSNREVKGEINYSYDTGINGTGWLQQVDGLLPGETFRYAYTPRGEVGALFAMEMPVPDGPPSRRVTETRGYNYDGSLDTHAVAVGTGGSAGMLRDETFTLDPVGRILASSDQAAYGQAITPTDITYKYSGMGHLLSSEYQTTSPDSIIPLAANETGSFDAMGNWTSRSNSAAGFTPVGGGGKGGEGGFGGSLVSRTGRYNSTSGRLRAETLNGDQGTQTDSLIYDAGGNLHAIIMTNAGSPEYYNERVSYFGVDGRLVAADARTAANTGTGIVGHTAFEEYRYDALGRRVLARVRRWCDDQQGTGNNGDEVSCEVSAVRRTVWSGSAELAEIQMPATDLTPSDTIENDTLAVRRSRQSGIPYPFYDANRLYGRVLYVHGLSTDQPLAITRVNYADASDIHVGTVPYGVYAPFSIIPLWNANGRADRFVVGGTAAPGADVLCVDTTEYRCMVPTVDRGEFPFARSGWDNGVWQGTVLVDKADATGTYYRRNRSYDPNTARFTQEDPIGLAGGMNLYGFASGDPANYSDPFGLCPEGWLEMPNGDCFNEGAILGMTIGAAFTTAEIGLQALVNLSKAVFGAEEAGVATEVGATPKAADGAIGDAAIVGKNEIRVSRWMSEEEYVKMKSSGVLQTGGNGRTSVTIPGAPKPGGTGPVRVDFNVPKDAVQTAGRDDWRLIFEPQRVPVTGIERITPPPAPR